MIRSRWAAIGAAVAVTLGAGGIGLVTATSPSGASTFLPIEPCRLFDTRPEFQVGPRSSPLGPNETFTVIAHGDHGECTGIPTTATGLGLNVTAVDPTQATVLTIWGPGDRPNASSLNPTPGQPPTPNAVTSGLTGAGELRVWNAFGSVHVIVDVVGFYTDHDHDDRYYTEAEVDTALTGLTTVRAHGEVYWPGSLGNAYNLTADNVMRAEEGVYCILGLPFTPINAVVSPTNQFNSGYNDVRVQRYDGNEACPDGTQIQVNTFIVGTTTKNDGNFAIIIF